MTHNGSAAKKEHAHWEQRVELLEKCGDDGLKSPLYWVVYAQLLRGTWAREKDGRTRMVKKKKCYFKAHTRYPFVEDSTPSSYKNLCKEPRQFFIMSSGIPTTSRSVMFWSVRWKDVDPRRERNFYRWQEFFVGKVLWKVLNWLDKYSNHSAFDHSVSCLVVPFLCDSGNKVSK